MLPLLFTLALFTGSAADEGVRVKRQPSVTGSIGYLPIRLYHGLVCDSRGVLRSGDGCDLVEEIAERSDITTMTCDQTGNVMKVLADCAGTLEKLSATILFPELEDDVKLECDQFSSVALVPAASCDETLKLINRRVLGVTSTSTSTSATYTTTTTYNQTIKDEEERLAALAAQVSGCSTVTALKLMTIIMIASGATLV